MKVFSQMALAGTGLLTVAAIVTALLLSDLYNESYHEYVQRHSRGLHQVLGETVADRVVRGEALELREILEQALSSDAGLAYLYVTDFDGRLFAHTFDKGFPRALLPTLKAQGAAVTEAHYKGIDHYSAPLIDGMSARIYIGADDSYWRSTLTRLQERVLGIALIVIALGLALWLLLARRIAAPLSQLTSFIGRYAEGSDLQLGEMPRGSAIEVRRLANALTGMVSHRKRVQEDLYESERRLRTLMGNLPGMAYRCENTEEWSMLFVSDGSARLTGYRPEELIHNRLVSYSDLIEPSERDRIWESTQQAVSSNRRFEYEYRIRRKDGSLRWVWEQGLAVTGEGVEPQILEGYISDITEQKAALQALADSETLLRATFDQAAVGIARTSTDGRWLDVNQKLCEILDYPRQELLTRSIQEISSAEDLEAEQGLVTEIFAGTRDTYAMDKRFIRRSGELVWIRHTVSIVREEDDTPDYFISVIEDIDSRKKAEEKLREAAAVFRSTGEGVIITDTSGSILDVNDAFTQITGYAREEVIGLNPRALKSGRHDEDFYQDMWTRLEQSGHWHGEVWNRAKDGTVYPEILTISAVESDNGELEGYVGVFADISSLKATEARLDHLAHHDPLTDLPNRLLFRDRLIHSLANVKRYGTKVAVVFFDVDRFKNINDTLGHSMGDRLLVEIAKRIKQVTRQDDTLGRISGDEFCLLLEGLHSVNEAAPVIEKLSLALAEPFNLEGRTLHVSASIGVAICPDNSEEADALLSFADAAMYEAKEAGRNTYRFYTKEMTEQALEHSFVQSAIRDALDQQQFYLVYQPQVDLKSGRLVGLESLLRWNHPERGLIPPASFIPIAEQSGLIRELGVWILYTACRQARAWLDEGREFGRLFVNVAGPQLHETDFPQQVRECLEETGMPPQNLGLEVTEGFVMRASKHAIEVLGELKAMGIELAIDDFGTGYSSLSYLKQLPIDKLKIDKSFVQDIPTDKNDMAIAEAVIAMGRALDLRVIAEGVENSDQANFLGRKGCQEAQGYLFSRPKPPREIEEWMRQVRSA